MTEAEKQAMRDALLDWQEKGDWEPFSALASRHGIDAAKVRKKWANTYNGDGEELERQMARSPLRRMMEMAG